MNLKRGDRIADDDAGRLYAAAEKHAAQGEIAEETEKEAFDVRELAFQIWQLICKYNMRAEFLECVESDISSGNNSADDLVMKLAKFEIDEILKTADMEFT